MDAAANVLSTPARARPADRAVALFLLGLMVIGSFALWVGVPAAVLYALAHMTDSMTAHYLGALCLVPLAMVVFGAVLLWINALYMRVRGRTLLSTYEDEPPRVRGPLGPILTSSLFIALVALLLWLAMFGGQTPQGAGAW